MDYTEKRADEIIAKFGLGRTAKWNWKNAGVIPDYYFDPSYRKPTSLTKDQQIQQQAILDIIANPLVKHAAFNEDTLYPGKLNEMLTLRRGQKDASRSRDGRPNIPLLNFSPSELIKITRHLQKFGKVLKKQLSMANAQPYEQRQATLKELLRSREELKAKPSVKGLEKKGATRWLNFVRDVRDPLPLTDRHIVAHVFGGLQDLLAQIKAVTKTNR